MPQHESDALRDERLLALLRNNDSAALDEILARFGVRVEPALKKRFSPALNDTDLEDIMAIGLARLWQARERYDPTKARLGTWLFVMARSAAVDLLRKRAREARAVVQHAARPIGQATSPPVT